MNGKLKLDDGTGATNASYYRSLVGGLNYLSHTRPDIVFSVSLISSLDDRKSTTGNVFNLGYEAVLWSSKKQDTIALSSSEAEYMAATLACSQAIWLSKLC
ncbi:uncharacterized mitochondrial protein AtMg00810-like [Solanum tuberosum]|uniref:uncharacterized mitochondrial protein AtMg00810-like n=1 Tax=Solanum tuberosum TaxID=4113 RepID=UPI00073A00E0|nr:PREDICTED: uncharacterized mitochondrial protein AtMg00810-like [Solanum tuberosum]